MVAVADDCDDLCTVHALKSSDLHGRFVIPKDEADALLEKFSTPARLHNYLMSLVEPASAMARAPISKFHVGAVGLGKSGAIYVGVNIEFPGGHLNNSIHAEQFLMMNCLLHGEEGIRVLAVSEAPCGHCRQFYSELNCADHVRFVFGAGSHWLHAHSLSASQLSASQLNVTLSHENGSTDVHSIEKAHSIDRAASPAPSPRAPAAYTLDQLLPARFGPMDLMTDGSSFPLLLDSQENRVQLSPGTVEEHQAEGPESPEVFQQAASLAAEWARKCYSPYTRSPSGCAIISKRGKVYGGGFIESVAFNPSLTPFHAAWAAAVIDHVSGFDQISKVVLAEVPNSPVQHLQGIRGLLQAVNPTATVLSLALEGC